MSKSKSKGLISKGIDPVLIWLYLALVGIGITAIFGVTYKDGEPIVSSFFAFKADYSKQLYFFGIALVMGIFILLTDSKFFTATANLWYAMGILLLLLVFPFHSKVKGTESIIRFGGFQFQPAEFCKVCVCLALSKYLSRVDLNFTRSRAQLMAAGIALLPAVLAKLQHETGLALVYFAFFIVMYREGLNPMVLVIGFAIAILIVAAIIMEPNTLAIILTAIAALTVYLLRRPIRRNRSLLIVVVGIWFVCVGVQRFAVPYIFDHVFEPYQSQRILATVGKDYVPKDPKRLADMQAAQAGKKKDDNYNVKQSKIAIGSGGFTGKGLLRGTQTRYDFVPEQRTDFIFCTVGEGFGFVGTFTVLLLYLFLLFRIVMIAERQRSAFSRCYAYGVASVFFFHIVVNVCMTIGLAPVIGIPLPFISYGGTALITFTLLLFILIRLDADRQMVLR